MVKAWSSLLWVGRATIRGDRYLYLLCAASTWVGCEKSQRRVLNAIDVNLTLIFGVLVRCRGNTYFVGSTFQPAAHKESRRQRYMVLNSSVRPSTSLGAFRCTQEIWCLTNKVGDIHPHFKLFRSRWLLSTVDSDLSSWSSSSRPR